MNRWDLLLANLRHRWGVQVLTVAVIAIGTSVLVGSFLVGHSMTTSLETVMGHRLGNVHHSLSLGDRSVTQAFVNKLNQNGIQAVGVVQSRGHLISRKDNRQLGKIQVWGIDEKFWKLGTSTPVKNGVLVNQSLAKRLELQAGDQLLLKLLQGGEGVSETVVGTMDQSPRSLELKLEGIVDSDSFGDINLLANQMAPYNLFIPIDSITSAIGLEGRVNRVLTTESHRPKLVDLLKHHLGLGDLEIELLELPSGEWELRSPRVFLESAWGEGESSTLFTYLGTSIQHKEKKTPYPIVAGLKGKGPLGQLKENGILLTDWIAEDLSASLGDQITLDYAWLDPLHRLKNRQYTFTVEGILPVTSPLIDPKMMPDFPGLKDSEHCRDWEVGFKMDLDSIRDKDETYWETHRGRPKAFIHYATAQKLWSNRFGDKTALRFPSQSRKKLTKKLLGQLKPSQLGIIWQNHRKAGELANAGAMDFSGLFMGFSLFISIASISLMHMLFRFRLEGEAEFISLQSALGFSKKQLRRNATASFLLLSIPGLFLGVCLGHLFGAFLLARLDGSWQDAIGNWNLSFHSGLKPSLYGALSGWLLAWLSLWPSLKKIARPKTESAQNTPKQRPWLGWLACIGAVILLVKMITLSVSSTDFFGLGTLLMILWISFSRFLFKERPLPFGRLSFLLSQIARRPSRSLTVILMMAVGSFMVLSLEAFRILPDNNTTLKTSGSGGFQLMLKLERGMERDLNDTFIQEQLGLSPEKLNGASFFPLRYSPGEDASCLNLNRAQRPNLIGIDPLEFDASSRFTVLGSTSENRPWLALQKKGEAIPVIGDQNTLLYSLGLGIGSHFTMTGEQGQEISFVVVGTIAPSIFQDGLLVDRQRLLEAFPSTKGFGRVMVEGPLGNLETFRNELNLGLESHGVDTFLTQDQLMAFHRVQNRYLSIFQSLGWLGLGLGCAGLFLVILQNVQDRKKEIALWTALGKNLQSIRYDFIVEHCLLFLSGLGGGMICGVIAIAPMVSGQSEHLSLLNMLIQFIFLAMIGGASLMLGLWWIKPTPIMDERS